ncbi:caspase family protein [Aquimarina sp. 2201CG5-10]|uniref:caspase family protein n=1 Tax=Aquimarina callyspongiae TaxID=3098150 RepID=UPI002AB3E77E|nr:caspase family protein [Aquimarina sp. 2201CG5-10]MDY8134675.1 caspase family protein [Aquimarina sp. 2201CG5-10]
MKKKWLGIALDIYDDPDNGRNLVASNKAITYWKDILENQFGFTHVDTENNSPIIDKNATKNNVFSALNKMVEAANEDDVHVFVFVGHGDFQDDKYSVIKDEILFDSNDHHDEKILLFGSDQIIDDEFRALLNKNNKKGLFILIFDCCYSGNIRSNNISEEEYKRIEQAKTMELIDKYVQLQLDQDKENILPDNLATKDRTIPDILIKKNPFIDKLEEAYMGTQDIMIARQNIKNSIDELTKKYPPFWSKEKSNKVISKNYYPGSLEIGIIEKNIVDLRSGIFMRSNPIEINSYQNEILICASSAYKKTYQPKIDGENQSAFSYLLIKNIKEYLSKDEPLDYKTLLKLTINKLEKENIYSYPQLIVSAIDLSTKQVFTK